MYIFLQVFLKISLKYFPEFFIFFKIYHINLKIFLKDEFFENLIENSLDISTNLFNFSSPAACQNFFQNIFHVHPKVPNYTQIVHDLNKISPNFGVCSIKILYFSSIIENFFFKSSKNFISGLQNFFSKTIFLNLLHFFHLIYFSKIFSAVVKITESSYRMAKLPIHEFEIQ